MDDGAKTDLSVVTIIPQLSLSLNQFWIQYWRCSVSTWVVCRDLLDDGVVVVVVVV